MICKVDLTFFAKFTILKVETLLGKKESGENLNTGSENGEKDVPGGTGISSRGDKADDYVPGVWEVCGIPSSGTPDRSVFRNVN